MAARSDLQTRIIISAQDRGASMLLKKLGTEADAATDKFAGMRDAFVSALGGISQGLIIHKAIGWIDDYENTVLSMATTLTDTMRNSGKDIQKVFDQNARHAESFFKLLQRQANRSYASFDNLKDAYMMFTNVGMALSPTESSARGLGNLVDRIRMATAGQAENIQIIQEMRSLLSGNVRAGSQMAIMFQQRDPEFARRIKGLVAGGSGQAVLDYLNSLLADFDMSDAVSKMFGKARSALMTEIQIASIEAFRPFKDEAAVTMREIAESMSSDDSPLRLAIGSYADSLTHLLRLAKSFVKEVGNNSAVRFLVSDAAPRILAIGSAASSAALAFGALRLAATSAMGALHTIPGMLVGGYAAMEVSESWQRRQVTLDKAMKKAETGDSQDDANQVIKSALANMTVALGAVAEFLKVRIASVFDVLSKIPSLVSVSLVDIVAEAKLGYAYMRSFFDKALTYVVKMYHDFMAMLYDAMDSIGDMIYRLTDRLDHMIANGINAILESLPSWMRPDYRLEVGKKEQAYSKWYALRQEHIEKSKIARGMLEGDPDYLVRAKRESNISAMRVYEAQRGLSSGPFHNVSKLSDLFDTFRSKAVNAMVDYFDREKSMRERADARGKPASGASVEAITQHQAKTDLNQNYQKLAAMSAKTVSASLAEMRKLSSLLDSLTGKDKGLVSYERNRAMLTGQAGMAGMSLYTRGLALEYQALTRRMKDLNEEYRRYDLGGNNRLMQETAVEINRVNERLVSVSEEFSAQLKKDIEGMRERAIVQNEIALVEKRAADAKAAEDKAKADAEAARQRQYQNFLDSMRSEGAYGSFKAGVYDYNRENSRSESEQWEIVGREVAQSVETSLSDGLYNFFKEGELDLVAMFQSVNDSLMRSMTDMIARSITDMIVNMVVSTATSQTMLTTSTASASASLFGLSSAAIAATTALASMAAADTGSSLLKGVSSGISLSAGLPGFATGGVVTSPTLAMIGEGGMNEAVVPMPDGRSIPVQMRGGGAGGVTVNIIDNSGTGTQKSVEEERDDQGNTILNVIIDAAARNTRGFRNKLNGALQR